MPRLPLAIDSAGSIAMKKGNSLWIARCWYRKQDGTYVDIRRRATTKEKARQAVRDAVNELNAAAPGVQLTHQTYFSEAANMWLEQYRADAESGIYSLSSADTYSDHLRKHVLPSLGNLRLFEVKTPVVNTLCQEKLKNNSLSLAKHTKAVISNVMTFAVQAGAIGENPVKHMSQLTERRAKTKRKKARALTAGQVVDFLGKLDADEQARDRDLPDLVRFFIATGERRGEALGAHWADFDAQAASLTMSGNIIEARGKGIVRNTGKSDTAQRTIPLPQWCVQMLAERRSAVGAVDPETPIFPNSRGGYVNASNLTNRYWVPFRQRAGYEWVTFHTFRKTVGTLLDEAGLTARQIADVLGHSQPSMTLNTYMGRGQESRASAEALDALRPSGASDENWQ